MIEIPDLEDIETSTNRNRSPNQVYSDYDQSGDLSREYDVNYAFKGHKYEQEDILNNGLDQDFNQMSINANNDYHNDDDEDDEEERFKNFQFSSNFEPRNDSNISNMSYNMKKPFNNPINQFHTDISTENTSVQNLIPKHHCQYLIIVRLKSIVKQSN